MKVTPDEARLLRETFGDEAAHLIITGSATRGGAHLDLADYSDTELAAVMRGCTVGIALTIADLQKFAGKAAGIVAELRSRQLARPSSQGAPPQPRPQARPRPAKAVNPDADCRTYEQVHDEVERLRSDGLTLSEIAERLAQREILNSRGKPWTAQGLSVGKWNLGQKARAL